MIELDAKGLSCPEPLMMVNAAMQENPEESIRVMVDSAAPRDNIVRLANKKKRNVEVTEDEKEISIIIT